MSEPVHVILNPASSNGEGKKLTPTVEAHLRSRGIPYHLFVSRAPGHVAELARDAAVRRAPQILVLGGDGTIHEIANGLLSSGAPPPPVGIIPVGTGNDFFRMVSDAGSVTEALRVIETGVPRYFDVGLVRWEGGTRYFVNLLGVGIDVEVLRKRERFQRLPGLTQYLAALVPALASFKPVALRITIDEEQVIDERALLCAVTVGPSIGGGFFLSPDALPDDGLLDLCLVERLSLLQVMRYLPRVIRGTHRGLDGVHLRQFRRLRLEPTGGEPLFFQLDGDLMEKPASWLEIELCAACLPILVAPRDAASPT